MKKLIHTLMEILFDFIVIFATRSAIVFIGDLRLVDLTSSNNVWLVSILIGLVFAEFFTITPKHKK